MDKARIGIFEEDEAARSDLKSKVELGGHKVVTELHGVDAAQKFIAANPNVLDVAIVGSSTSRQRTTAIETSRMLREEAPAVHVVDFTTDDQHSLPGANLFLNRELIDGKGILRALASLPGEGGAES